MPLTALALNCTLKPSPSPSSTQAMLDLVGAALDRRGVPMETARVVDHDVRPGVSSDEGGGDQWPVLLQRLVAAEVLVLGTPVWMGSPSSVCKRVCERLDAMLGEIDDRGRTPVTGKVALVAVVGNEDGAHHVSAECYQWLSDVGFTVPPMGVAYWVGEAMGRSDFRDLPVVPPKVTSAVESAASAAVHLAQLLAGSPFPGVAS